MSFSFVFFSLLKSSFRCPLFCKGFCIFLGPISREKRKEKSNLKNRAFGFLNLLLARIGRSFSIRTEANEEERQRRDKRNAPGHVFYFCSHSPSLRRERESLKETGDPKTKIYLSLSPILLNFFFPDECGFHKEKFSRVQRAVACAANGPSSRFERRRINGFSLALALFRSNNVCTERERGSPICFCEEESLKNFRLEIARFLVLGGLFSSFRVLKMAKRGGSKV